MDKEVMNDMSEAGTGFMLSLADIVRKYEGMGYTESLSAAEDHFKLEDGRKIFCESFVVDHMQRSENTSDPDDNAVVYAISVPGEDIKGLFIESFGLYHEDLSREMRQRLRQHH